MIKIEEIKNQIQAYDKLIEELVEANAPDKVIGKLEIKRQKLVERCNKLEANNSTKEDPYAKIAKGQSLPIPQEDPYAGQINQRRDVFADKSIEIEKLNRAIEIYDDMILKIGLNNPEDVAINEIKNKRSSLARRVDILVSETNEVEYKQSAYEVIKKINKLDTINDKIHDIRIVIRRTTKNLFKIITSPDYTAEDMPPEVNELLILKQHKRRLEEQEQQILNSISKFFKERLII